SIFFILFFFFFQAEDGIRDLYVTGVQTCALPIYFHAGAVSIPPDFQIVAFPETSLRAPRVRARGPYAACSNRCNQVRRDSSQSRSEERRVGKECRSRRSPDD